MTVVWKIIYGPEQYILLGRKLIYYHVDYGRKECGDKKYKKDVVIWTFNY